MAKSQPRTYGLPLDKRDGQLTNPGGLNYFLRSLPVWNPPAWQQGAYWRAFVEKQSIAAICRDRIADYLNSLDWAIVARDSDKRDELRAQIKHYTKLFERGNAYYWDIDFSTQIEWFAKDLFTLPFGTASELGRLDDEPNGRVVWIRPLDGATLAPTLNFDYPVVQSAPGTGINPIYLPREFVARVYLSPRTEIEREGWGYAPPERIWRALEMLSSGDTYYAQLLLNTPEAGILDLGDMEQNTALKWVESLRDLMYGISPLKIPVLYEHTTDAKWIPFGKPPSEIMYDSVTMRYAAILAAGYGLTLSDIGFPSSSNGGETLAGTIRSERVGKSSGKSTAKKKWEAYANRILPATLKWSWIDYDDERNVSKGRARLASAQAADIWIKNRVFTPGEVRQQNMADGLISIDVPEQIDPNSPEFPQNVLPGGKDAGGGDRGKSLGNPVAPSQGGQGEIIPQQIIQRSTRDAGVGIAKAVCASNDILLSLLSTVRENLNEAEMQVWDEYVDGYLISRSEIAEEELKGVVDRICDEAKKIITTQSWTKDISGALVDRLIEVQAVEAVSRARFQATEKAEADFIAGKSDDLVPEENIAVINPAALFKEELHGVIHESLVQTVAQYAVSISKSHLLSGKLDVDSTERIGQNIRVSREIANDVLQNFSRIVSQVYELGSNYLDGRINENV